MSFAEAIRAAADFGAGTRGVRGPPRAADLVSRRRPGRGAVLAGGRGRPRRVPRPPAGARPGDGHRPRLQSDRARRRRGRVVVRSAGGPSTPSTSTEDLRIVAGAAAPDAFVAEAAATAGVDGLAFLRGVPGAIGGALRMNAGPTAARSGTSRRGARPRPRGAVRVFANADMGYSYRHSEAPETVVFTRATLGPAGRPGRHSGRNGADHARARGVPADPEKTGGSTFRNPPGARAWELIDKAGCRGLVVGDAEVSTMHCNFLINRGRATAADLETLGEDVRRRVRETSGVTLELGDPADRRAARAARCSDSLTGPPGEKRPRRPLARRPNRPRSTSAACGPAERRRSRAPRSRRAPSPRSTVRGRR